MRELRLDELDVVSGAVDWLSFEETAAKIGAGVGATAGVLYKMGSAALGDLFTASAAGRLSMAAGSGGIVGAAGSLVFTGGFIVGTAFYNMNAVRILDGIQFLDNCF